MHGKGVILEVEFKEVETEQYKQMFVDILKNRFGKELSANLLDALAQAIEESRLAGQAPADLAANLVENWKTIFGE
jgi:hypothetical protein